MIRIDFVAPPLSGHLFPLLYLARQLVQSAPGVYDVRFITGPGKKSLVESAGFPVYVLVKDDPTFFERLVFAEKNFQLLHQYKRLIHHVDVLTDELKTAFTTRQTEIAVIDFVTYPATFAANEINLPWLTSIPTPFAIENEDGTPPFFKGLQPPSTQFGQVRDWVLRKMTHLIKKGLIFSQQKWLKPYLPKLYDKNGQEKIYSSEAILALGLESFQFPRTWPKQLKFVGYGVLNEECQLDIPFKQYRKNILVTMGTMAPNVSQKMYACILEVAQVFPDILFVVSGGAAAENKQEQRNNVLFVSFVPYDSYLPEFDYVIHHGGAGIVHVCIKYGKPSLVVPQMYDQFDFAARIHHFELGLWCKKMDKHHIVEGLNQLMKRSVWPAFQPLQSELTAIDAGKMVHKEIQRVLAQSDKNNLYSRNLSDDKNHVVNNVV